MVEALFLWALAVYGAIMVVWQTVRIMKRLHKVATPHPVNIILIVQDAESSIEGILRSLLATTLYSIRRRTVLVLDVQSRDDTGDIVRRLETCYEGIHYCLVDSDDDIAQVLCQSFGRTTTVSCVYDLRNRELLRDVTWDVMSLLP